MIKRGKKMKHYDIIILGAGASGCMCAITAGKRGKNVLVIDKLAKAGKKLLATGNGRCNLTNEKIFPSETFYNQNIDCYLKRFNNNNCMDFFMESGLLLHADEQGRFYPFTNSAKSVVDVLNNEMAKYQNITLSHENEALEVEKNNDTFIVKTAKDNYSCQKLVVATGGKTAKNIFEEFKLPFIPYTESLVALKTQNTRNLENVKVSGVSIEAKCQNKIFKQTGEILFKDSGVSGIAVFNVSTLFARLNDYCGEIKIDLMPIFNEKALTNHLKDRRKINVKIKNFFDGMLVKEIGYYILNQVKIDNEDRSCVFLTDKEIESMAYYIKNMVLKVKGRYDNNQVYSGGIELNGLNENLESKKIKNLFFCGEVCDVDGICGGYNLQWAWTSGHIVGESL